MFGGSYTVDFGDHPQGIFRMGSGTPQLQSAADGANALTVIPPMLTRNPIYYLVAADLSGPRLRRRMAGSRVISGLPNLSYSTVFSVTDHAIIDTWQSGQVEFTIRGCIFSGDDRWWGQCGIFHEYLESASWIGDNYGAWRSALLMTGSTLQQKAVVLVWVITARSCLLIGNADYSVAASASHKSEVPETVLSLSTFSLPSPR